MRWEQLAGIAGVAAVLAAGSAVILMLIATEPASPLRTPAPTAVFAPPPVTPHAPAIDPAELFGIDPGRMLLYDREPLQRDVIRELEDELRRLRLPAGRPFDRS